MEGDIYRRIGRRLREERRRREWTQEDLADKTEMHPSMIGQIERGTKKPSLRTVKILADALEIKAGDLFDEGDSAPKPHPLEKKMADILRDCAPQQQQFLYRTLRQLARQTKKIAGL